MENTRLGRTIRLILALSLTSASAFGVEFRAVNLKVLPPSAVVVTPQAGLTAGLAAPVAALVSANQAMASQVSASGPVVVLQADGAVLMIPQTIRPGAQALVMPQGGGQAQLVPITKEIASSLAASVKKGDIAAAAQTLGHTFDASASVSAAPTAAPVVASDSGAKAPAAKLEHSKSKTPGKDATGVAPPAPAAPKTDVSDGAESKPKWDKAKPLPPSVEIPAALASLDDAVEMSVTHPYPGKEAVDPSAWVDKDIEAYINDKSVPKDEKHFVLKYFEIGDPKVVSSIEKLVKAGIKTTILTDFNQSMTLAEEKFAEHHNSSTEFEKADFKPSNPGKALEKLTKELGFTFKAEGKFTVLSGVPLFRPSDKSEKPLMHDKGYFAMGKGGKAWEISGDGTANMNATQSGDDGTFGGRYNRVFRHKDAAGNQVDWDHVVGEIKAYGERTFSKGLPEELNTPKRVMYPNGEWREIAFTNGKQNPNDRIIAMLERAAKSLNDAKASNGQPDFELDEIIFSHFVLTDTPEVDALRKYLDALRGFYPNDYTTKVKIFGVFDQQFISPGGFGEAAALDGLLVQRPMGKSIFPFRTEYQKMMQLFGYIRLLDGVKSVDPDKAPTNVHLWHDKTTMIKAREKNSKTGAVENWTYAWSRSLNDSGHFQSLESQDMYRMKPDSRLAKDMEASIKEVVKAEPKYALDLDKAIAIEVLAQITHHTRYDDGMLGWAEKAVDAMVKKNYQVLESVITEIISLPTKHVRAVDGASVKAKLAQFIGFLNWYDAQAKTDKSLNQMTYRKALNIAIGMIGEGWGLRTALDIVFWGPNRNDAQTEQLMKKAWTEGLKMEKPFPEPKAQAGAPAAK